MTNKNQLPPQLEFPAHLVLDFGLPLAYQSLGKAYTHEKLSLWAQQTNDDFLPVVIRTDQMHRARVEGTLYYISDPKDIQKLDRMYQVGYACDRTLVRILIPYQDEYGNLLQAKANIYLARYEYYEGRIAYDQVLHKAHKYSGREYRLSETAAHENRLLNNRFSLFPDPYPTTPERPVNPAVAEHVAWKNRIETERLRARNQQSAFTRIKAFLRE